MGILLSALNEMAMEVESLDESKGGFLLYRREIFGTVGTVGLEVTASGGVQDGLCYTQEVLLHYIHDRALSRLIHLSHRQEGRTQHSKPGINEELRTFERDAPH